MGKIESELFRINDKLLIAEWNKLLDNMRFEKGLADTMISTLAGDFQPQPRAQEARDRDSLHE